MATQTDHVLTISTATTRLLVKIDGRDYQLRTAHQLTIEDNAVYEQYWPELIRITKRIDKSRARSGVTTKDAKDLAAVLRRLVPIVLEAPKSVHDKLTDSHRMDILKAFMTGSRNGLAASGKSQRGRRSTGSKSSRRSRATTEAIH